MVGLIVFAKQGPEKNFYINIKAIHNLTPRALKPLSSQKLIYEK